MQKRVQQFSPSSGPRKTKEVMNSMNNFIADVVGTDGQFIDKDYKCTNPFGKCEHCSKYVAYTAIKSIITVLK